MKSLSILDTSPNQNPIKRAKLKKWLIKKFDGNVSIMIPKGTEMFCYVDIDSTDWWTTPYEGINFLDNQDFREEYLESIEDFDENKVI